MHARLPVLLATALATGALLSCATGDRTDDTSSADHAEALHDVMRAKLVHSRAMYDAIILEDFDRIAVEASGLTWLSQRSDWQVHETVAYAAFSDEFRDATEAIARSARAEDLDAVLNSYATMTDVCMRCHQYLRREGLYRDMPGAISLAVPPS